MDEHATVRLRTQSSTTFSGAYWRLPLLIGYVSMPSCHRLQKLMSNLWLRKLQILALEIYRRNNGHPGEYRRTTTVTVQEVSFPKNWEYLQKSGFATGKR